MDEYTSRVRVWELLCPGIPEEVARARRWTRDILTDCPCADDAALIVTELGANAVTHTTSPDFRVTIHRTHQGVTLTVTDRGDSASGPHLTQSAPDDTHGRGLAIVAMLTTELAVARHAHGHTVTAHLAERQAQRVNDKGAAC
ncbi:ATP-binding protein [Streptomyces durbertensis]|uniref:ATP-binding protein n=1 Tax=Streptomyces durbertensis TaxID=2448886 RepID=A0ABR6ECT8_9ACTN|nr:ATP-binding protein [Streptomyces durbertensis]MBB1243136.1 ATP-binding protein [Streptomyces durbertensis]